MVQLQAEIGADASDLIRETGRARDAFGRFTKQLTRDADSIQGSFELLAESSSGLTESVTEVGRALRGLRSRGLSAGLRDVGQAAGRLTREISVLGNRLGSIGFNLVASSAQAASSAFRGLAVGAGALGAALAGIGTQAALEFSRFEESFAQVRTLVDESQVDIQALDENVRDLAQRFGVSLTDATQAAYQAISAGVEPARAVEFLETAFRGAAAGAASVEEVTRLVTSTLNAFNRPLEEAIDVSDVFFTTIRRGVTTASELSSSLGQVGPIAAAAGIELEEVAAAFSTLTSSGVSTAEAATQIRAAITAIIAPSQESAAALEELGINAAQLREEGLEGVFTRLRDATGGSTDQLARLLPNVRALAGAATLAGTGFQRFTEDLEATQNAVGATDTAFERTASTISREFARLTTTVSNTFVTLGRTLAPIVSSVLGRLRGVADTLQGEFELLGEAFERRFTPQIVGFFETLGSSAEENAGLAERAVEQIADSFEFVGRIVRDSAGFFGTFSAGVLEVVSTIRIVANSIQSVLGVAILTVTSNLQLLVNGLATLADAVGADGIAGSLRVAQSALEGFNEGLTESTQAATASVSAAFEDATRGADRLERSTTVAFRRFGDTLLRAGTQAREFGREVSDLRAAQDGAASSSSRAQSAVSDLGAEAAQAQANVAGAARAGDDLAQSAQRVSQQSNAAVGGVENLTQATLDLANAQRQAVSAFDSYARAAGAVRSQIDFSGPVGQALTLVNQLTGVFRTQADELVASSARGSTATRELLEEIQNLAELQDGFLDASVFERFALAAGEAGFQIGDFGGVLDEVRVVANVLEGDFRRAADGLVDAFAQGRISSADFRREIERLGSTQLGFDELFRSVQDTAEGFQTLGRAAREARGELAQTVRDGVSRLREDLDAGRITLDQYIDGLREAGDESERFRRLSESQAVVFNTLRQGNAALADQVSRLSSSLRSDLQPAFANFLEAFRQGALDVNGLQVALAGLAEENERVAETAEDAARGLERQASAARRSERANQRAARSATGLNEQLSASTNSLTNFLQQATQGTPLEDTLAQLELAFNMGAISASEFEGQVQGLFQSLQVGNQNLVDAAAASRLFDESQTSLIPKIEELGRRLGDTGRNQLRSVIDAFAIGASTADEFRASLQALADTAQRAGRAGAASAGRISAFGRPGGIQATNRASAGSQLLGLQGRVTGSSNFQSQLEADLGEAAGLAPRALRSAIGRSGGLPNFLRERQLEQLFAGRFASGGPVNQTGFAQVEAGEFVLGQRGLTELGRLVASALGSGNGEAPQVSQQNTFNLNGALQGGNDMRELARMLEPELRQLRTLGASRSPLG